MECTVCLQSYISHESKQPHILSCGHTFCIGCIDSCYNKPTKKITCPTCREPSLYDRTELIPKNFSLYELLESHASKEAHQCESCEIRHSTSHQCLNCREYLCPHLLSVHKMTKWTKNHRVVSTEDAARHFRLHPSDSSPFSLPDSFLSLLVGEVQDWVVRCAPSIPVLERSDVSRKLCLLGLQVLWRAHTKASTSISSSRPASLSSPTDESVKEEVKSKEDDWSEYLSRVGLSKGLFLSVLERVRESDSLSLEGQGLGRLKADKKAPEKGKEKKEKKEKILKKESGSDVRMCLPLPPPPLSLSSSSESITLASPVSSFQLLNRAGRPITAGTGLHWDKFFCSGPGCGSPPSAQCEHCQGHFRVYREGQQVRLRNVSSEEARRLQQGHGGYVSGMDQHLGCLVSVRGSSRNGISLQLSHSQYQWNPDLIEQPTDPQGILQSLCVVLESSHPYLPNTQETRSVSVPGARGYSVFFDRRSSLSFGFDYLSFFKDESRAEHWGDFQYTGGPDPGSSNFPIDSPLTIPADRFVLNFQSSDEPECGWGYCILVCPYFEPSPSVVAPQLLGMSESSTSRSSPSSRSLSSESLFSILTSASSSSSSSSSSTSSTSSQFTHLGMMHCQCEYGLGRIPQPAAGSVHLNSTCQWECCGQDWIVRACKFKVLCHPHDLTHLRREGWNCDGRGLEGQCRSGCRASGDTRGKLRFRCDECDFDLCSPCLTQWSSNPTALPPIPITYSASSSSSVPSPSLSSTTSGHSGLLFCRCAHNLGKVSSPGSGKYHLSGTCQWECCGKDWSKPSCTSEPSDEDGEEEEEQDSVHGLFSLPLFEEGDLEETMMRSILSSTPSSSSITSTNHLTPSHISASTTSSSSSIVNLCDGNDSTYWQSDGDSGSHWIQITIPTEIKGQHYSLELCLTNHSSFSPKTIILSSSSSTSTPSPLASTSSFQSIKTLQLPQSPSSGRRVEWIPLVSREEIGEGSVVRLSIRDNHNLGCDSRVTGLRLINQPSSTIPSSTNPSSTRATVPVPVPTSSPVPVSSPRLTLQGLSASSSSSPSSLVNLLSEDEESYWQSHGMKGTHWIQINLPSNTEQQQQQACRLQYLLKNHLNYSPDSVLISTGSSSSSLNELKTIPLPLPQPPTGGGGGGGEEGDSEWIDLLTSLEVLTSNVVRLSFKKNHGNGVDCRVSGLRLVPDEESPCQTS